MADWALSTNLFTWAQAGQGFFAWPATGAEADDIRSMNPGDIIVPKYAQAPAYGDGTTDQGQRAYCEAIDVDYDDVLRTYEETVRGGAGAAPEVLRVTGLMEDDTRYEGQPWARVSVTREPLAYPLSTKEFLRLRVIPPAVAQQFKAAVAQGRHLQKLEPGTADAVISAAGSADRADTLRRYTLVRSGTADEATAL